MLVIPEMGRQKQMDPQGLMASQTRWTTGQKKTGLIKAGWTTTDEGPWCCPPTSTHKDKCVPLWMHTHSHLHTDTHRQTHKQQISTYKIQNDSLCVLVRVLNSFLHFYLPTPQLQRLPGPQSPDTTGVLLFHNLTCQGHGRTRKAAGADKGGFRALPTATFPWWCQMHVTLSLTWVVEGWLSPLSKQRSKIAQENNCPVPSGAMWLTGKNMDYEIRDAWMSFSRQRRLGNSVNISKVWFPHVSSGNTNPCSGSFCVLYIRYLLHLLDGNPVESSFLFSFYLDSRKETLSTHFHFLGWEYQWQTA